MRLRLDIDTECYHALNRSAVRERRSLTAQAEILLRRALGLTDFYDPPADEAEAARRVRGES